jgi:hypothetical protein
MSTGDSYLTMARIMKDELEKYRKKDVWGKQHTDFEEILMERAFESGFMAGFSGKYFGELND